MIALLILFLGVSGGLATGAGYVAFITVLGVIPRLMSATKTKSRIHSYELALVLGVLAGTLLHIFPVHLHLPAASTVLIGLFSGLFIGMAAAALTEVLNVFPILSRRAGVFHNINGLMMAVALGKTTGSLIQWILFWKM
ncbi:stage V sporulation protein AB [Domibacillus enclensis]|uniref:Stage V sporulation protein AB n=1 Tax=Domibacillus enclensis TaxID=1017273 RepID=A0A1N6PCX7_9BACI|nr:stage V sporulation protein AB [Domibacillus enclensis]OXS80320.1 stage V sporulation protein AB [Domibacillus enclensis]SIQ02193.1 stage V sporulation protein AB [Domibacillus enclensis]